MTYEEKTKAELIEEIQILQERTHNYRKIIESVNAGVVVHAPDTSIITSNDKAHELLGLSREQMVGKVAIDPAWHFKRADETIMPLEEYPISRILQTQKPFQNLVMGVQRSSNETLIWVLTNGVPVFEKDELIEIVVSFIDITEQIEIEKRLKQQASLQQQAIQELSTPIIPIMEGIIVLPLVGNIDSTRARDLMRTLLAGITEHRAKMVIIDITGVPLVDTGVVAHLDKTIQAARLKGSRAIVTGISDAVAEAIVDLGIDWSQVETVRDLQSGLSMALKQLGL